MKTTSVRIGLLLAVLGAGCVSTGHFTELSQQDQERFQRCRRAMQPVLCGDDRDTGYVTMCIRGAEATYGEQVGAQRRRQWLLEQGCPAPMVNPAPYAAAEPPDAPMPRRHPANTAVAQ